MALREFDDAAGGFGQRRLMGLDLFFELGGSPLQLPEIAAHGQRPGAEAFAARHQAMLIVLAGPGQKMILGVGAGQALGGGAVLDEIRVGEGRQSQVAIEAKRFLKGDQLAHRGDHAGLGKDLRVVPARVLLRTDVGDKESRAPSSLLAQQRDAGARLLMLLHHHAFQFELRKSSTTSS